MEQTIDIRSYLKAFRRRLVLFLLPVFLLTPVAAGVAYVLPPKYSATARVLVESQQIPSDLARSTVRVGVAERVALIEQRLMTREVLLDIARKHDVFRAWPDISPSATVDLMRSSTTFRAVRLAGGRDTPVNGVNITFTADRANVAADVANEFLTRLLEQNLRTRNQRATETSEYFRAEAERLTKLLGDVEVRLTRFKIDNEDALPDSLDFRRRELAALTERVFSREIRIGEIETQRDRLLEAIRSGELAIAGLTPEEREIRELEQTLMQRRTIYAESHPSIRLLQSRIAVLKESLALSGEPDAEGGQSNVARAAEEALRRIEEQIETTKRRRDEEVARIEQLQASIERTPNVQLELAALQREYSGLQEQYSAVVSRLVAAETGERLEVNRQAERFEVIEQARPPSRPDAPNRPVIAAAGLVGSIGLGFGFVILAELMNRSVRTPQDLERQLQLRPIVSVPYIETEEQIARRKWMLRIGAAAAVIGIPAALFAVDQYVLPLPLVIERFLDITKLGPLIDLVQSRISQ